VVSDLTEGFANGSQPATQGLAELKCSIARVVISTVTSTPG
jgi:hypothetical protein